jgi:hypothetical protein
VSKKTLFERMIDKHAPVVEDVTLETVAPNLAKRKEMKALLDEPVQHKAGCTYQRHPFVCNCQ